MSFPSHKEISEVLKGLVAIESIKVSDFFDVNLDMNRLVYCRWGLSLHTTQLVNMHTLLFDSYDFSLLVLTPEIHVLNPLGVD